MNEVIPFDSTRSLAEASVSERRQLIQALEKQIQSLPDVLGRDDEIWKLTHYFAPGIYARQITVPEGMVLTGAIHRHPHLFSLVKGEISIMSPEGPVKRIQAPHTFLSPPNTKRAILGHVESVLITFHATSETDLAKLEAELIAPDFEPLKENEK